MKTLRILLTFGILAGTLTAEYRTWTRNDGKTAVLELSGTSGEGDDLKGTFRMRNGKTVDLAVSDLSTDDAELVRAWKPQATASVPGVACVFDDYLDGNLVKLEGKSLKKYELEKKPTKYYLFYYTASWCGPCQAFTPSLVKFYDTHKPESDEFEIILITSDESTKDMEDYASSKGMNWPHLKESRVKSFEKKFNHPGTGIPNLVLTDLEGNLIKTSYVGKQYVGPHAVMEHLGQLLKK